MNSRILALGLCILAAAVGAVWFTWRPTAPPGGAESAGSTTAPHAADPRAGLARPDGSAAPDTRTVRGPDAIPPVAPATSGTAGTAATTTAIDPGMPVSLDQAVTDESNVFAAKYRELGPEARRSALLLLESEIAVRVNSGDLDPAGKDGPSLADLKAEVEWLRTHPEG